MVERKGGEFQVGQEIPILQHKCKKGSLGQFGKIEEINKNNIPVVATCDVCGKTVTVDIKQIKKDR
ncbi:MAG: hypothetical protein KatS3mg088_246 [Patescibacteria group bacterium]|nr:MAG: hypothetical protein KatS3mg088_246 [Patescibacteria group bacterium]